jgi:hypothetical protein
MAAKGEVSRGRDGRGRSIGRGRLGGGRRCHREEENGKKRKENQFSIFGFKDPIYEY